MLASQSHHSDSAPSATDIARQLRFAEHLRRQRFFQQENRWPVTSVLNRTRPQLLVPGEDSDELEPLTCAMD